MNKKTWLLALTVAVGLIAIEGCKTKAGQAVDRLLFRPTAFVTNDVPETVVPTKTNQIVIVTQTNAIGEVVGRVTNREPITINITVPAHQEVKPVAWEANPNATSAIGTVAGFIPGYGTLAGWAATALLGVAAAIRSGKYKDAAISVAQGVEHFVQSNPSAGPALKATLASVQSDHGTTSTVKDLLAKDVESAPKIFVASPPIAATA